MHNLDENKIVSMAPNSSAIANGKKISKSNGFVKRWISTDGTFYMGECKGSGKSNYITSGDFIDIDTPIFRCSCPSRQFPCKHSIALMFEIISNKEFSTCEIPEDILNKREKKDVSKAKKIEKAKTTTTKKPSKASLNAKRKKMEKQLEGLAFLKKMTDKLIFHGLAAISGASLTDYKNLNKQLTDYYLPGVQVIFNHLLFALENLQKVEKSDTTIDIDRYEPALHCLKQLRFLAKKSTDYLQHKLESDTPEADDNILYEALGGIWRLEELAALGLKRDNVNLIQLSFSEIYNEPAKAYIDKAYWVDLSDGRISYTANIRPMKALKYIQQEDSCFEQVNVPMLFHYPCNHTENTRIRWETAQRQEISKESYQKIFTLSYTSIADMVKTAKNELKNILSDGELAVLLQFHEIVEEYNHNTNNKNTFSIKEKNRILLTDYQGASIELSVKNPKDTIQLTSIRALPDASLLKNQTIFGLVYFDIQKNSICLDPRSLITQDGVIRLLY